MSLFQTPPAEGQYCSVLDVETSEIRAVSCDQSHPPLCRRGEGACYIPDTIQLSKANIGHLNVNSQYGASNAKNCTCQMRMENSGSYGVSYGCYGRAGVVPSPNFHDNCNTTNRVFNGEECFILMTSPLPLDEAAQMCYAEFASPISEVKSRSTLDALLNAMSIGGYVSIRVANNILNDPAALSFNFAEIASFNGSTSQWKFYDNSIVEDNLQISSKKPSHSPSTPKPGLAIYYDEVLNMTGLTTVDPREPYPYLCSSSKTQTNQIPHSSDLSFHYFKTWLCLLLKKRLLNMDAHSRFFHNVKLISYRRNHPDYKAAAPVQSTLRNRYHILKDGAYRDPALYKASSTFELDQACLILEKGSMEPTGCTCGVPPTFAQFDIVPTLDPLITEFAEKTIIIYRCKCNLTMIDDNALQFEATCKYGEWIFETNSLCNESAAVVFEDGKGTQMCYYFETDQRLNYPEAVEYCHDKYLSVGGMLTFVPKEDVVLQNIQIKMVNLSLDAVFTGHSISHVLGASKCTSPTSECVGLWIQASGVDDLSETSTQLDFLEANETVLALTNNATKVAEDRQWTDRLVLVCQVNTTGPFQTELATNGGKACYLVVDNAPPMTPTTSVLEKETGIFRAANTCLSLSYVLAEPFDGDGLAIQKAANKLFDRLAASIDNATFDKAAYIGINKRYKSVELLSREG
ncbi:unnamed protein product [Cyprideis torosa]|uniref:Uncharacterized protein n=1 Tax=Cyprideis torosa TaxID=163714 RepID=A0A7R8WHB0_9CRUS|nr:unnamed protein product [Cyprideis torosa]CAG0893985.1 unnamed protein product [Cyprideis torosa]